MPTRILQLFSAVLILTLPLFFCPKPVEQRKERERVHEKKKKEAERKKGEDRENERRCSSLLYSSSLLSLPTIEI